MDDSRSIRFSLYWACFYPKAIVTRYTGNLEIHTNVTATRNSLRLDYDLYDIDVVD